MPAWRAQALLAYFSDTRLAGRGCACSNIVACGQLRLVRELLLTSKSLLLLLWL